MTTITIADTLKDVKLFSLSPLEYAEVQRQAAAPVIDALNKANATIKTLQDAAVESDRAYDVLVSDTAILMDENRRFSAEIDALKKRNAELEFAAPPPTPVYIPPEVVTPPVVKPPDDWLPFCGIYIEDPRTSDSVNDQAEAKEHAEAMIPTMEFAAQSKDITDYITFCNPEDLKYGELPKVMRRLNKMWWQSPIQAYYIPGAQQQTVLIDLYKSLHDAGVYGGIIDDAQNVAAADMEQIINLWNKYVPGAPVMASFLANFDDHAAGYPFERYIDMRQWFLRNQEKEGVWFPKWETAHDAEVYAADCYRRENGFMHTPARLKSMFEVALPMVNGVAFYSMLNKETDHMKDHLDPKQAHVRSIWSVIQECAALYQVAMRDRQTAKTP